MKYLVDFDYRPDNGPRRVGPFDSRLDAELYVQRLAGTVPITETSEWHILPLHSP